MAPRNSKTVVETVELPLTKAQKVRAAKEAALAPCLAAVAANATDLAQTDYVKQIMVAPPAVSHVTAGAILDHEALEMGIIINSNIIRVL